MLNLNLKSVNLIWILLVLSLLLATLPLFKPYVAGTADGLGHRFRLVSFYNSLKEGNIRPRWAGEAALGFGAPTFLFNYPLPYYLGSLFLFLGFSVNSSGQILAALSLFLSGFFMFFLGRRLFGSLGGLVAAIVYTYAPYHLQMTYLYDAWGEITAFMFPPLILYLSIRRYFVGLVAAWFLFILSHNVSVLMFAPVLIFLSVFMSDSSTPPAGGYFAHLRGVLIALLFAIILSSFFWLPALVLQNEMKYPEFLATEGAMRGSFFKSFSLQWETAFRVIREGSAHYLDFTIGLPIVLIIIVVFLHIISSKLGFDFCTLIFALLSIYLTNYASHWLWNLPPLTYILYPFRFLFMASFVGALLAGQLTKYCGRVNLSILGVMVFILLTIVQGRPYLNPYVDIFPFPDSYFYERQTVTAAPGTKKNMLTTEFLPKFAERDFLSKLESEGKEQDEVYFKNGKGKIRVDYSGSERLTVNLDTEKEDELIINRFYFPNWEVWLDGQRKRLDVDRMGRMLVSMPVGHHEVDLVFGASFVEKVANIVSFGGLLGVIVGVFLWKY